jgi:hypothetical protein
MMVVIDGSAIAMIVGVEYTPLRGSLTQPMIILYGRVSHTLVSHTLASRDLDSRDQPTHHWLESNIPSSHNGDEGDDGSQSLFDWV